MSRHARITRTLVREAYVEGVRTAGELAAYVRIRGAAILWGEAVIEAAKRLLAEERRGAGGGRCM